MTFALDGKTYEIDLTTANADKLRGLLEPYVKGGRRTGGRASGGRGKARAASGGALLAVAWPGLVPGSVNICGRPALRRRCE